MFKQSCRLVQMTMRFPAARHGEALEDFRLQRSAEAFDLADAVFLCRRFEVGQRGDSKLLMELEDLVRPEARDS